MALNYRGGWCGGGEVSTEVVGTHDFIIAGAMAPPGPGPRKSVGAMAPPGPGPKKSAGAMAPPGPGPKRFAGALAPPGPGRKKKAGAMAPPGPADFFLYFSLGKVKKTTNPGKNALLLNT